MPSWLSALFHPFLIALATVVAGLHHLITALGADPGSSTTWLATVVGLVVVVRISLLPLVIRQVRLAHAGARARPAIEAIRRRHAGRTDPDSVRRQYAELRQVRAEHGIGLLAGLPILLQLPVMLALFRVVTDVAAGITVGPLTADLIASARAAEVLGAGLGARLTSVGFWPDGVVLVAITVITAVVTYLTHRYLLTANLPRTTAGPGSPSTHSARSARSAQSRAPELPIDPEQVSAMMMRVMPTIAAIGILASGTVLPLGVLIYWFTSALWTAGQQAVINRWAPTPGSPAFERAGSR